MLKQAIVLAAGEGSRLRPFTLNRPKSMLYVAGRPIIEYVIEALAASGIRDIVLVTGYRKEQIFEHLGSGEALGVNIRYAIQAKQLSSAHALAQAKELAGDEFLVVPGDKYFRAGTIECMICQSPTAMLVKTMSDPSRGNIVAVARGSVTGFGWPEAGAQGIIRERGEFSVNTRIYALSREVFGYLDGEPHIPAVLAKMAAGGHCIRAIGTDGEWQDVVYPWDIIAMNSSLLERVEASAAGTIEPDVIIKGSVVLGGGSVIRGGSYVQGPVVLGKGCVIGPHVSLSAATSLGDNVVIEPFSHISGSVIGSDVRIGAGSIIEDSVIDRGSSLSSHFQAPSGEAEIKISTEYHSVTIGALIGESCRVGAGVVARPGTILGAYSQVAPLKVIGGSIPDRSLAV